MLYLSTRGHPDRKHFCDILLEGLAPDGGLYLPEHYPQVSDAMDALPVLPMSEVVTSYYLRLRVADQAGVLAKVTGILAGADIKYAEQLGYRIKLLGITKRTDKGIELRVHPSLVPSKRLIANVEGAMNAVVVNGDAVGTTLYYGKGAGSEPTASAVIADLVDVTRLATSDPQHRVPHLAFQPGQMRDVGVLPMDRVVTSCYLRLRVADEKGVLARVATILAENGISIDAVLQREADEVGGEGSTHTDLIILTHEAREGAMNAALAQLQGLPSVLAPIVRIRKEELN